jgi:hypothetical protein
MRGERWRNADADRVVHANAITDADRLADADAYAEPIADTDGISDANAKPDAVTDADGIADPVADADRIADTNADAVTNPDADPGADRIDRSRLCVLSAVSGDRIDPANASDDAAERCAPRCRKLRSGQRRVFHGTNEPSVDAGRSCSGNGRRRKLDHDLVSFLQHRRPDHVYLYGEL